VIPGMRAFSVRGLLLRAAVGFALLDAGCAALGAGGEARSGAKPSPALRAHSIVAPQVARDLPVTGPAALAMDSSGNSYVVASVVSSPLLALDGPSGQSHGDSTLFLASYDAKGEKRWALGDVGDGNNPAFGVSAAVTSDGTLAAIGHFAGTFSINGGVGGCVDAGGTCLSSASPIDLLAGYEARSGTGKWAHQFNDGANGNLLQVAANPNDSSQRHGNRIAVCGFANATAPSDLLGPSAVAVPHNTIILGVFTSAGEKLWATQYIAAGAVNAAPNADCNAIAVDDDGDVIAAGTFSGSSLTFGNLPALYGPDSSFRKFIWVAKFNGSTGAPERAVAFSGAMGLPAPTSLAVDAHGDVALAGKFTAHLAFGSTLLSSAGGSDAFVTKLNAQLSPLWAARLGGPGVDEARGVAVDSAGDVITVGFFSRTATASGTSQTIAASLPHSANPFVLKINGLTGSTDQVVGYPDNTSSSATSIAVNRYGPSALDTLAITGQYGATLLFPPPAGAITSVGLLDAWLVIAKSH